MRRFLVPVTVALFMAAMLAFAGPASAQGGCEEFGQRIAEETEEFHPFGQVIRTLAPVNDQVENAHAALCPAD